MRLHPLAIACLGLGATAPTQHCAPLYQSFLSEASIRTVRAEQPADDRLQIHVQYAKEGGQAPAAYQGYLVAYLDRDVGKVPAAAPADVLDPKLALVLHTQVMQRREKEDAPGPQTYDLDFEIRWEELVDKVIAHAQLGAADREDWPNWHHYKDHIRFALFVPWLEDKKYAVLPGLPEKRHECNYLGTRALVFQELPTRVLFLVSRDSGTRGRVWLQLRSDQPAASAATKR